VHWKGYDPDPTWYPVWNFVGCPHKLKEFHKHYPGQPGPAKYLNEWLECWYDEDNKNQLSTGTRMPQLHSVVFQLRPICGLG